MSYVMYIFRIIRNILLISLQDFYDDMYVVSKHDIQSKVVLSQFCLSVQVYAGRTIIPVCVARVT